MIYRFILSSGFILGGRETSIPEPCSFEMTLLVVAVGAGPRLHHP